MATFSFAELRTLFRNAGGPAEWADTMAAVALAESSGCQYALHGPRDYRPVKQCSYNHSTQEDSVGLWQINVMAHPQYDNQALFNPSYNASAAVAILGHGTPTAWSTYTNGAYKAYLGGRGDVGGATNPFPDTGPTGLAGPIGLPKRLPAAWHFFVHNLAQTAPTQLRRQRVAYSRYRAAVRGSGPRRSGLRGPIGKP